MKHFILTVLIALSIKVASAGILIEPYIGYNFGTMEGEKIQGIALDYYYLGPNFGGRVGGSFLGFELGVDYNTGTYKMKWSEVPAGVTLPEFSASNLGVFAGFSFPILIRGWVSYYINSSYEDVDKNKYSGSGYSIGVGLRPIPIPLPFISLCFNAEYRQINLDELDAAGTTSVVDREVTEIMVSVSTPINI